MQEQAASTVGRYEIKSLLGRGCMGVVYLAHDPVVCRDVALKTIRFPPGFSEKEKQHYQERFLREARAGGGLSHPGIVTIYEFHGSEEQGQPYIAMEYVAGQSLKDLLASQGPGEVPEVFATIDALAAAIEVAHRAGVIHRDLKPANILVREADGAVKIADFGVARMPFSELTQTGSTMGSPAYMAPERLKGRRADERSDLFSLAVIFYEALCGERPFVGDDAAAIMAAILHGDIVPITSKRPDLPETLNGFFSRALAKEPDVRFRDAAGFRKTLQQVWRGEPVGTATGSNAAAATAAARPAGGALAGFLAGDWKARLRNPRLWQFGVPAVLLLAFVLGWTMRGGEDPAAVTETVAPSRESVEASASPAPRVSTEALPGGSEGADVDLLALGLWPVPGDVVAQGGLPSGATAPAGSPNVEGEQRPTPAPAGPADEAAKAKTADGAKRAAARPAAATRPPAAADKPTPKRQTAAPKKPVATAKPAATKTTDPGPATNPGTSNRAGTTTGSTAATRGATAVVPQRATLMLQARTTLKQGTLVLLLDGDPWIRREIASKAQGIGRVFKQVARKGHGVLDERLELSPGRHVLLARVEVTGKDRVHEETVTFEIEPGQERTLQIKAGRTFGKIGSPLIVTVE